MRKILVALCSIALSIVCTFMATAQQRHALVNISVACLRANPSHSSELVSQQLMGFPVNIISAGNGWAKIETLDGYEGYIIENSLHNLSDDQYEDWKDSKRVIYSAYTEGKITDMPEGGNVVSDIVPGAIVEEIGRDSVAVLVSLPDGRSGYLPLDNTTQLEQWSKQGYSPDKILEYARANIGSPYLWGGLSAKAMDCSGLTWTAYFLNGRLLMRDASDQAATSSDRITDVSILSPGDLLFFGNRQTQKINHVAIYEADGRYLHSSGRLKRNSLRPEDPDYNEIDFLYAIDLSSAGTLCPIFDSPRSNWLFKK